MSKSLTTRAHGAVLSALAAAAGSDEHKAAALTAAQSEAQAEVLAHDLAVVLGRVKDNYVMGALHIAGSAAPNGKMPKQGSNSNAWRKAFHATLTGESVGMTDKAAKTFIGRMIKVGLILAKFPDISLAMIKTAIRDGKLELLNEVYALDSATVEEVRAILEAGKAKRKAQPDDGSKAPKAPSKAPKAPSKSAEFAVATSGPAERLASIRAILAGGFDGWTAEDMTVYKNGLVQVATEFTAKAREVGVIVDDMRKEQAKADAQGDMANA